MTTIVDRDAKILREHALDVPLRDIGSKKIADTIRAMQEALHAEDDGVAIAAPQIGESLRIFVVNGEALSRINNKEAAGEVEAPVDVPDLIFINPKITKLSKKRAWMEEGCLSVRWLYGKVLRSEKATIVAYNEAGKKVQKGASGLLAQIFQHEVDHLDGVLFTDKAKDVEDVPPEKNEKDHV